MYIAPGLPISMALNKAMILLEQVPADFCLGLLDLM